MTLKKATLQEIDMKPTAHPQPIPGSKPIPVQVNPTSLHLSLSNNTDVGKSVGRPNTTFQGSSSSTLTFDLMMDTADQGTTTDPTDVQTLTAQLQYFLLPKTKEPKAVPPRVLFIFGTLQVAGVMSGLNLEYNLFSDGGVPLRAKASVTIKEQMPQFDANLLGAGANKGSAATDPVSRGATGRGAGQGAGQGAGAAGPGGPADRTGTALGGESAADFAARMGLDPSTWKSFAAGIADPLHLDAGLQIDFSSSASVSAGIGLDVGATSAAVGNTPGASSAGGAMTPVESLSPAALTAAGGVSQAITQQALGQSAAAAAAARAAFGPESSAPVIPTAPGQAPTPGTAGRVSPTAPGQAPTPGTAGPGGSGAGGPVPQLTPDPRAISFGFGVPLRPLIAIPSRAAVALVHDLARGQTWPPAGTLGTPAGPGSGQGAGTRACGCPS